MSDIKGIESLLLFNDSNMPPSITPSGVALSSLYSIKFAKVELSFILRVPEASRMVLSFTKLINPASFNGSLRVDVSKVAISEHWAEPTAPIAA